jgi:hypothetical protein
VKVWAEATVRVRVKVEWCEGHLALDGVLAAVESLVVGAEHLGRGMRDGDASRRRLGAHARRLYACGGATGVG